MKKIKTFVVLVLLSSFVHAQDSTKTISHEIGFNLVSLISQFKQINTSSVTQLPYDVFYNVYYKNTVGLRIGAGVLTGYNEDAVNKQTYPKETTSNNLNLRFGLSYNYLKANKLVLNGFVDYVYENIKYESVSSATTQVFPNPIVTKYDKQSTVIKGAGFQIGTGIKYNAGKHISFYAELPFVFLREKIITDNLTRETGVDDITTNLTSRHFSSRFILPATVYLVLRF